MKHQAEPVESELEPVLSVSEVAQLLGVSEVTVRRSIKAGKLPAVRVGKRRLGVPRSAVRKLTGPGSGISSPDHAATKATNATSVVCRGRGQTLFGQSWSILQADAIDGLASIGSETVDCIVTSPPYFWQRDYGYEGQIGHEPAIQDYVSSLQRVFAEARRTLKPTGLLFLNLGDTYYSAKGRPHGRDDKNVGRQMAREKLRAVDGPGLGLPRKSLIGLPWRVALALQEANWTLRSNIIWRRPGSLGEPTAKDRPWRQYEHIFMFSKSVRYHFDRSALSGEEDVWTFAARPDNPDFHFAPYPLELVQRCLAVGCVAGGTVLDPFVGSGTTAVAALQSGRSAIGIDRSERYCRFAAHWSEQVSAPSHSAQRASKKRNRK